MISSITITKLFGAVMIVTAGGLIGDHFARRLSTRARTLENLRIGLERLKTEIGYAGRPLAESFRVISNGLDKSVREFFAAVATLLEQNDGKPALYAWQSGLAVLLVNDCITKADESTLNHLGPSLGNTGKNEQSRHIDAVIARVASQIELAQADAMRYCGMYRQMGVLCAIGLALLLS